MVEKKTDTLHEIETPEGIVLHLRAAGCPIRAAAWLIDLVIRAIVYLIIYILLKQNILGAAGVLLVLFIFVFEWFYPVYFEVFSNGQTPGKKRCNIKVVSESGTAIGWQASIIRNFIRLVDFFPFMYGIGLISCFLDKSFRRLGDLCAGTLVVYAEDVDTKWRFPKIDSQSLPLSLTQDEQSAIISFTGKYKELSKNRQRELAEILMPLHELKGGKAVKTVHSYAIGILGHDQTKSV